MKKTILFVVFAFITASMMSSCDEVDDLLGDENETENTEDENSTDDEDTNDTNSGIIITNPYFPSIEVTSFKCTGTKSLETCQLTFNAKNISSENTFYNISVYDGLAYDKNGNKYHQSETEKLYDLPKGITVKATVGGFSNIPSSIDTLTYMKFSFGTGFSHNFIELKNVPIEWKKEK